MKSIEDHTCAIWLGDLNYRLHLSGKPDEQVWKLIREGHLDKLLEADELCREMAAGRVFKVRVWEAGIMAEVRRRRNLLPDQCSLTGFSCTDISASFFRAGQRPLSPFPRPSSSRSGRTCTSERRLLGAFPPLKKKTAAKAQVGPEYRPCYHAVDPVSWKYSPQHLAPHPSLALTQRPRQSVPLLGATAFCPGACSSHRPRIGGRS